MNIFTATYINSWKRFFVTAGYLYLSAMLAAFIFSFLEGTGFGYGSDYIAHFYNNEWATGNLQIAAVVFLALLGFVWAYALGLIAFIGFYVFIAPSATGWGTLFVVAAAFYFAYYFIAVMVIYFAAIWYQRTQSRFIKFLLFISPLAIMLGYSAYNFPW